MDRDEWLAARKSGLGSSDAAAACGLYDPERHNAVWGTPLSVYMDKLGLLPPLEQSDAMGWGLLLEDDIAAAVEQQTGLKLPEHNRALYRHPEYTWMVATPDRYCPERGLLVELKTSVTWEGWGPEGTDEVPAGYLLQAVHQMAVLGLSQMMLAAAIAGRPPRIYRLHSTPALVEYLVRIEEDLWHRIERREPPDPDWRHPDTPRLLDLLHRPDPGQTVELDWDARSLAVWHHRLGEQIREAEKERDRIRAQLVQAMGQASVARFPDGWEIRRKVVAAKEVPAYVRREYVSFTVKAPKGE